MKKFLHPLMIFLLLFFLSGCSLLRFIDDGGKVDDILPKEKYQITYSTFLNNQKQENLGQVTIEDEKGLENIKNKLIVDANEEYSFAFILLDGKVISLTGEYNFTNDKDYHFEIHFKLSTQAMIIVVDDDNHFITLLAKEKNTELSFKDHQFLVSKINIPEGYEFSSWDKSLTEPITKDVVIKPNFILDGYAFEASLVVTEINDINKANYQTEVFINSVAQIIEQGMIFLESNYYIDELTIDNINADIIKNDEINKSQFTIEYIKSENLYVRSYMILENTAGRREVIYSNIIRPAFYAENLFFSYYIMGSSYNKAIAIYNGTKEDIDLSSYTLKLYNNGSTTPSSTIPLSGIVPKESVFIISHSRLLLGNIVSDINNNIINGMIDNRINHNGDDAYELYHFDQVIDQIGTVGFRDEFGKNNSYQRSAFVYRGNTTNWNIKNPFTFNNNEWISKGYDSYDGISEHKIEPNELINKDVLKSALEELNFYIYLYTQEKIDRDIFVPKQSQKHPNVLFRWFSSDEATLNKNGEYLKPLDNKTVDFTVEIIINGEIQLIKQHFSVEVLAYQEYETIFSYSLAEDVLENWTLNEVINGHFIGSNSYLITNVFRVFRPSTLLLTLSNSAGTLIISGFDQNDNLLLNYYLDVRSEEELYKVTFLDSTLSYIKISFYSGELTITQLTLVEGEKSGQNDFTPPVIVVNIPKKIVRGSFLDLDSCYAVDDFDDKVSCDIIYNDVNLLVVGQYKIIFEATDLAGNTRTLEVYIEVYATSSYMALDVDPDEVMVKFIDIGKFYDKDSEQGESTYIKIGEIDILIDAGMPYNNTHLAMKEVLDKYVTGKLDYVIATHPHQDHIGGFPFIFDNYDVGMAIYYSTQSKPTQTTNNFINKMKSEPGIQYCEISDIINGHPEKDYCHSEYQLAPSVNLEFIDTSFLNSSDPNASSIVFTLKAFNTIILLTGDAEEKQEAIYANQVGKVNIFKMGHHGSRNGTSELMLNAIDPEVAIISNGTMLGNKHGHPTFEAINRVYKYNSQIKIFATTGGGVSSDACSMVGSSYKCSGIDKGQERNGTIEVKITPRNYIITSSNYGANILELSSTHFWINHPQRIYSYKQ